MELIVNIISKILIFFIEHIPKDNIISIIVYVTLVTTAIDMVFAFVKSKLK